MKYLSDPELNLSNYSNPTPITVKGRIIEVHEGDHITCGAIDLTVYETPGHTPGGVCYYMPGLVFVGDTLFNQSVGRTDFVEGDYDCPHQREIKQSYIHCQTIRWYILDMVQKHKLVMKNNIIHL